MFELNQCDIEPLKGGLLNSVLISEGGVVLNFTSKHKEKSIALHCKFEITHEEGRSSGSSEKPIEAIKLLSLLNQSIVELSVKKNVLTLNFTKDSVKIYPREDGYESYIIYGDFAGGVVVY